MLLRSHTRSLGVRGSRSLSAASSFFWARKSTPKTSMAQDTPKWWTEKDVAIVTGEWGEKDVANSASLIDARTPHRRARRLAATPVVHAAFSLPNPHTTTTYAGANKGIGFEIARMLTEAGMTVIATCRDREQSRQRAPHARAH